MHAHTHTKPSYDSIHPTLPWNSTFTVNSTTMKGHTQSISPYKLSPLTTALLYMSNTCVPIWTHTHTHCALTLTQQANFFDSHSTKFYNRYIYMLYTSYKSNNSGSQGNSPHKRQTTDLTIIFNRN